MRAVFVGASSLAIMTAHILLKRGHEVVIIDLRRELVDELANELDCGLICGDGSTPAILRESGPEQTDFLFCLTNHDQTNIIASLVGRSLKFKRVVTQIENPQFEHVCVELGLENIIIPDQTIGRFLGDMFEGHDPLELSAMIKDEARVFAFVVRDEDEGPLEALVLPEESRVMCHYRDEIFSIPAADTKLKSGDEIVLVTHSKHLPELQQRWGVDSFSKRRRAQLLLQPTT